MLIDLTLAVLTAIVLPFSSSTTKSVVADSPGPGAVPLQRTKAGADEGIEDLKLQTEDKLSLAATYYAPPGKSNVKAPGAVLLHPPGGDRQQLDELARYLQRKGFGVIACDLRGHGASVQSACDWKALDEKGKEAAWALAIRDVASATSYLRERQEVHANNISLIAVAEGGSLAVRQAQSDDTVRAIVLISPTAENFGFNLVSGLGELAGLPTLIVASKEEREVAARFQNVLQQSNEGASAVELQIVKSAPSEVLSESSMRSALAGWLRDRVAPKR